MHFFGTPGTSVCPSSLRHLMYSNAVRNPRSYCSWRLPLLLLREHRRSQRQGSCLSYKLHAHVLLIPSLSVVRVTKATLRVTPQPVEITSHHKQVNGKRAHRLRFTNHKSAKHTVVFCSLTLSVDVETHPRATSPNPL